MRVYTESGSVYLVDTQNKTWERVIKVKTSGTLRTESGVFNSMTEPEVGEILYLLCPPMVEHATGRAIVTSRIVRIEDDQT